MKKRIIAILLTATMTLLMTACGSTGNSNVDVSEENVASEATEVPETTAPNTEEVVAETETEIVDTRLEDGMAKIQKLFDAHTELLAQNKLVENTLQSDTENLDGQFGLIDYCTTKDGKVLTIRGAVYNTAIIYYNNYINNNGDYYDIQTWISEQDSSESIYSLIENTEDTNTTLLAEAIGVVAYMKSCESVVGTDVIETTDYVISGISSAYIIPLNCDGDTALTAVFDADGNLLNICTPDDGSWNNYMSSLAE